MKKYLIHWHVWDCPGHEPHHNYTVAPGLVNCPRCIRKFGSQLTHAALDAAVYAAKAADTTRDSDTVKPTGSQAAPVS